MKKYLKIFVLSILALSLLFAVGCGTKATTEESKGEDVKTYKVGTDAAYAPFESVAPSGEIEGFDVDIMRAIAKAEGFEVEFVNTAWEGIFASLKGQNDIVISAVTITDDRKKEMDFSEPYFESTNYIAVPKDSNIASLNDLKGKVVAVQEGTTGDEALTKFLGKDYRNIKRFKGTPEAFLELRNGKADAAVADSGVVANYVKNNPDANLKIVKDETFPKEYYGIAVAKGNTELLAKINSGLKKIKENGEYDKIYSKWFSE
ncbi:basic amino acid ABC transporter substrate-binding protein [Thermincola potens]|uniref:Extracellular solute-binding protein family 3 n=1 Tax=Thermincola potens (strain JR) TaxID=635013 RepID=D5XEI4_THEPJ|nr:basic amino acid ABC transporter substrate-binding protein [Thermincola potens]ADG82055.1 extracellular solute-binding protein family 3 [Thermincola potens JR]